jgi:diacylglycerol kinase (ATP)
LARRCYLIVNPTSGSYSQKSIDRIVASLRGGGIETVVLPTKTAADTGLFAARLCAEQDHPLIAVAGGDGTVNGALNGLVPGAATLAVIPTGTSNVLARELDINSVDEAVKRIIRGKSRAISIGEMECAESKRRFVLMAGAGVDGAVVQGVRLAEKRVVGKGAYVLSALRLLLSWDSGQVTVSGGGKTVECHSVIICNAAKYGGNFVLCREADLFTPGFQVICIKGGPWSYLKLFLLLAAGRVRPSRAVSIFAASEVEVSGSKAVQLDGDFFGCGSLRLRSIPDFVRVIV